MELIRSTTFLHISAARFYQAFFFTPGSMRGNGAMLGILVGTIALDVFRPRIEEKADHAFGEKLAGGLFLVAPLVAMGLSQWLVTRRLYPACGAGVLFFCTSAFSNQLRHDRALAHVWNQKRDMQRNEPRTYIERKVLHKAITARTTREQQFMDLSLQLTAAYQKNEREQCKKIRAKYLLY